MKTKELSILTGWGGPLGTGHMQRMAAFADHVNRHTSLRAFLVCDRAPDFLPPQFKELFSDTIRPGSGIIIRDKRDSETLEMKELKAHARLIAVDDCGPGRDMADLAIDLLPNLKYSINTKELFLYGYAFADSVRQLDRRPVTKDIDYALYCGNNPSPHTVDFFLSLIPEHTCCALLAGNASRLIIQGAEKPLRGSYAETLLSSNVLISHFGITLYEGSAAGCRLIAINPTDYHSRLCEIAKDDLALTNLGVLDAMDPGYARNVIADASLKRMPDRMDTAAILTIIDRGIETFLSRINPLL